MTTWAGIVRVSHMGSRKSGAEDFHSERDQVKAMQDAVARLGGTLVVLPAELDVSGGLPLEQRPSLLSAVEGVEGGKYGGIIVAYQSRLGRDVEHEEAVWRRVEAAGGRIEMALDGLDTGTVDGRMVRRIRSSINAAERERHAQRFDDLRRGATAAGIWQRRQTPLGYRRGAKRKLERDDRARDVRRAFIDRAAGVPVTELADRLGMTANGVRMLLRNRVYLGELKVGKYVNTDAHPALVTVQQFEAAQVTVSRPGRGGPGKTPALLAGLVRCQACGHVMSSSGAAYACFGRSSGGPCPRPAGITVRLLDEHVTIAAKVLLRDLSMRAVENRGGVQAAMTAKGDAEREMTAYLEAVSAADVGAQAFAAGARHRREAVERATFEVRRQIALQPVTPSVDVMEVWESLNGHERNSLLRGFLDMVIVKRAGGRGARSRLVDRVRVIRAESGIVGAVRRGGEAAGVVELPFPDRDDERVVRVP